MTHVLLHTESPYFYRVVPCSQIPPRSSTLIKVAFMYIICQYFVGHGDHGRSKRAAKQGRCGCRCRLVVGLTGARGSFALAFVVVLAGQVRRARARGREQIFGFPALKRRSCAEKSAAPAHIAAATLRGPVRSFPMLSLGAQPPGSGNRRAPDWPRACSGHGRPVLENFHNGCTCIYGLPNV